MSKANRAEINFDTLTCEETLSSKLNCTVERLKAIKNPWTGNKKKLVYDIFTFLEESDVKCDTFLDLFSGSGVVGIAAKALDKKVISNDLMTFAYYSALCFVENDRLMISDAELKDLINPDDYLAEGFVTKKYHHDLGNFTLHEAKCLDTFYKNVNDKYGNDISNPQRAFAILTILYYVMQHCYVGGRLNKGQVLADLDHRLNHAKNKNYQDGMSFKKIPTIKFKTKGSKGNVAYNKDAIQCLKDLNNESIDVCYIDPPYGGDQSDYAKMYTFFEEYIHCNDLESLSHFVDADKFVSKKQYEDHFREILINCSHIPALLISYNETSWSDIDYIIKVLEEYRKRVDVKEVEYLYKYREKSSSKEYLILCQ